MSSFLALLPVMKEECLARMDSSAKQYHVKNKAAVTIQRFVRGYITRQHFKKLNQNALLFQKYVKGYITRRKFWELAYRLYFDMLMKKYDHSASLIQAAWRGYCVRKNVLDYYKLKKWHQYVLQQNENLLNEMRRRNNPQIDPEFSAEEVQFLKDWIKYLAFKTHHLIRTKAIPGVFSVKDGTQRLSLIELFMKSFNMKPFIDGLRDERLRFLLKINDFKKEQIWLKYISNLSQVEKIVRQQYCIDNTDIL